MKLSMTPGGKSPLPPRKGRGTIPKPPSHIPWPVRNKDSDGCFPPGGVPGKPAPQGPHRHPLKTPTPNRRGR